MSALAAAAMSNPDLMKTGEKLTLGLFSMYGKMWQNLSKIVIVLIIAIVIIYFTNKAIKGLKSLQSETKVYDKEIEKDNLTYSLSEYETWADNIERAMKGWGTDQDTMVYIIKKMKTKDDFYQLIKAYDMRSGYTLTKKMAYELDDNKKEREIIRNHLNSIGVNY